MKFSFDSILIPILFTITIWMVFGLQFLGFFSECYGIIPHNVNGLKGILFAPLFHGGLDHIFGNTFPMMVLLFLTFTFYNKIAYLVLVFGWILSGFLVWIFPYFSVVNGASGGVECHIGASGLIYLLSFFLFSSGIIRKNVQLMAISLLVVFLYGGLIWGVLPQELISDDPMAKYISWESHLSGGVVGIMFAFIFRKYGPQKTIFPWQKKGYYDYQAEILWEEYKEKYPEDFEEIIEIEPKQPKKNDWDKLL